MPGPQEARFAAAALTGFSVTAATRDQSSAIDGEDCGAHGVRRMVAAAVLAGIWSPSLSGPVQS
jgi:hypothetical protein